MLALPSDDSARASLLDAIEDQSLDVARTALRRLVPLAGPAETARLRGRMLELDVGIVGDVAAALGKLGDVAAIDTARSALGDASPARRQKAALALRELAAPASRHALLQALRDPAPAVRRLALEALTRLPRDDETVRSCAARLRDADPAVRSAAVAAVAELDPHAAATLSTSLADPHPAARAALARSLPALSPASARLLLDDADRDVRVAAFTALTEHPRPELVAEVRRALNDPSWHIRRAAVDALGASGRRMEAPALVDALSDEHPIVRARALFALEHLLGNELPPVLVEALPAAPAALRRAIVEILGACRQTASVLGLVDDPDARVRVAVVHALEDVRTPQARAAIGRLAADRDDAVRHAATMALGPDQPTRSKIRRKESSP